MRPRHLWFAVLSGFHAALSHGLRSENGPEFVARSGQQWVKNAGIRACYIEPGAPWGNGHVERFHAQLRAELLDRELYIRMQGVNP